MKLTKSIFKTTHNIEPTMRETLTAKKCRACKEQLNLELFPRQNLGKGGRASTCYSCGRKKRNKDVSSMQRRAKLGEIQWTIPAEKKKAYQRDKKCIVVDCHVYSYSALDFHHVFWRAAERDYTPARNLFDKGVMLCRAHHDQVPKNAALDSYCRAYLSRVTTT